MFTLHQCPQLLGALRLPEGMEPSCAGAAGLQGQGRGTHVPTRRAQAGVLRGELKLDPRPHGSWGTRARRGGGRAAEHPAAGLCPDPQQRLGTPSAQSCQGREEIPQIGAKRGSAGPILKATRSCE